MGGAAAVSAPTDPAAFRLATFLVTAARDVIDEPAIYAPFRMIDAVDRLMAGSFDDAFLAEIQPELERARTFYREIKDAVVAQGRPAEACQVLLAMMPFV